MTPITLQLRDENDAVVNGTVSIYDQSMNRVVQELSLSGQITSLELPEGTYFIRVYSTEATFNPTTIVVNGLSNLITYKMIGVSNEVDAPSDATMCKVYGRIIGLNNKPIVGAIISISNESGYVNSDDDIQYLYGSAITDSNGRVEMVLKRNASYILTGIPQYNIVEDDLPSSLYVTIPDQPVCKLIDIIAPIPSLITPTYLEVASGSLSINPEITLTNGTKVLKNFANYIQINSDTITAKVGISAINIDDLPVGTHELYFYAKTFQPKKIDASGIVKRSGLPKLVGQCTIVAY
jgi:hypothetical protein